MHPNSASTAAPHHHDELLPGTPEDVHRLIDAHIETHRQFPESARLRDLGAEKALVQDYSGRVVFELLQNALDRAMREIEVRWDPETGVLEVANDGRAITTTAPTEGRSDLTALLTLHTSSKTARESVGNKGVGFRSVFASSNEVEVCSRAADGRWWGLRLRHPATLDPDEHEWNGSEVASFYAPERWMVDEHREHCTVIRLRNVRNGDVVAASVRELQDGPLTFLERRASPGLRIRLLSGSEEVVHVLGDHVDHVIKEASTPLTDAVRRSTGLDLDIGEVRVLWIPADPDKGDRSPARNSRYWSYLPTEQPAGFGVQVHGDFYLSNSRRNLALRQLRKSDRTEDPAGWNARLVDLSADCIVELWQDGAVCASGDFWRVATPAACQCSYLKLAVAKRFWSDGASIFRTMTRLSFPEGSLWPLQRYRDYFDAISAWADYAYRNQGELGGRARYMRVRDLLGQAQASGAPVLPIASEDPQDFTVLGSQPLAARPLVAGQQGQRRGADADRIYQLRFDPERRVELPAAVRAQRTFVTTFEPGVDSNLGPQGLLEFDRLEILAQLQPGGTSEEHAELIGAAVDLARQEARGGPGSLLQRAKVSDGGAAWRFVLVTENVNRAGFGLAGLHVPTTDGGWARAADCGTIPGPWPMVDRNRLAEILESSPGTGSASDAELLLGLTPIPLGETGTRDLPRTLAPETGVELLRQWPRWGGFLDLDAGRGLRQALSECRWVGAFDGLELRHGPEGDLSPYRPLDVWHQQSGRGFTTGLLPRLILDPAAPPRWLHQLGVRNPAEGNSRQRLTTAIDRLRRLDVQVMYDHQRDLIELYRALVVALVAHEDPPAVPLLVRPVDQQGRREPVRWARPGEAVWHEPDGADREALQSFTGVLHWVVRKQSKQQLGNFGLRHFRVDRTTVQHRGESSADLEHQLRDALTEALPDILAASVISHIGFDVKEALQRFTAMTVRHFDDVWIEWEFDGQTGGQGEREQGDVFLRTLDDGRVELCFDGPHLPLVRCALPLSELLAENRAFGPLYKDALHAWLAHERDRGASVQRFRREQGLGEREVQEMRDRVQASVMPAAERAAWVEALREALRPFGTLAAEPDVGMVIRPQSFAEAAPVHEEVVREAVARLPRVQPRVDFYHSNGIRLDQCDRSPLLAEMAERHRGQWTEANLQAWKQRLDAPHPDEEEAQRHLGFDPVAALRARLGLPVVAVEPAADARSFADGQIPLRALPVAPASGVVLRRFSAELVDSEARDAQSDEDFIRQARRRAHGGKRAEDAVLNLAVVQALRWRRDDPEGFLSAFQKVIAVFDARDGNKAAALLEAATGEPTMRSLLHVAEYVGNVGFDVLVPDSGRFLLVEVKRVAELSGAAFFLSENERRRALRHRENGLDWRLWLVAGNGASLDATSVIEPFDRHRYPLHAMASDGLRPGDWFFVLG
jgi:hypothetical protein